MWYFYAFHFITQYKKKDKNLEGKEPVTFTVEPNTIILVFVASPLNTHLQGVSKHWTGGLGIRVMCPSGVTCLPADCGFSELAL